MDEETQQLETQNTEQTPPTTTTETQSTTVETTASAPSTDEFRREFQANLQLANENQRLMAELNEIKSRLPQPQSQREVDAAEFLANPGKHIREMMNETVAPLIQFKEQFDRQNQYSAFIANMRTTAPAMYAQYESVKGAVDQMMQSQPLTPQTFQAALISAIGARSLGLLGGEQNTPTATTTQTPKPTQTVTTPPHIPPSAPTPPRSPNTNPNDESNIQLTEAEERVRKIYGMSKAEFVKLRDADAQVSNWK